MRQVFFWLTFYLTVKACVQHLGDFEDRCGMERAIIEKTNKTFVLLKDLIKARIEPRKERKITIGEGCEISKRTQTCIHIHNKQPTTNKNNNNSNNNNNDNNNNNNNNNNSSSSSNKRYNKIDSLRENRTLLSLPLLLDFWGRNKWKRG